MYLRYAGSLELVRTIPQQYAFNTSFAHHYFRPNKQIQPIMLEPVPDHAPGAPGGHHYAILKGYGRQSGNM
jgi:hypothetical protein